MSRSRSIALPCLTLLVAIATAACATDSEPAADATRKGRQCFFASDVNGFTPVDDRTVDVRVRVRDVYRLELVGYCPDVDWTTAIGIRSRGGTMICSGLDAELIVPSTLGPRSCLVRSLRKLTDEEIKAGKAPAKEPR